MDKVRNDRTSRVALICAVSAALACGNEDGSTPLDDGFLPTSPGFDAGGAGSGADGGEPPPTDGGGIQPGIDGGVDNSAVDAGLGRTDAGQPGDRCGDQLVSGEEQCDGASPTPRSCQTLGFDFGDLSCNLDCTWNTDACSGTESCVDGRDNDGDGLVDCQDVEDCAAACSDACLAPASIAENSSVGGSTLGHASVLAASCGDLSPSGSEVVYRVDVSEESKLDVTLSADAPLSVSVRTNCAEDASELSCGVATRLTLDALEGETYFVVVDGLTAGDGGDYVLTVETRQEACGDAIRDVSEQCDDGNISDGDGCDPDCFVESNESEPNDSLESADTYDFSPWVAEIEPAGDEDHYRVNLVATSSTLVVNTLNLGDGACGLNLMDTEIDVHGPAEQGFPLLVHDDDGGDGACSRAVATGLAPGDYTLVVRGVAGSQPTTFPYRLSVSVGVCGDGDVTLGEECDDGNLEIGDGCDATCAEEQ